MGQVPADADITRMSVRQFQDGLEITMPSRRGISQTKNLRHDSKRTPETTGAARGPSLSFVPRASPLPYPSDGIEVIHEDFQWPEKSVDAVEGFFDNRGDFHFYYFDRVQGTVRYDIIQI